MKIKKVLPISYEVNNPTSLNDETGLVAAYTFKDGSVLDIYVSWVYK